MQNQLHLTATNYVAHTHPAKEQRDVAEERSIKSMECRVVNDSTIKRMNVDSLSVATGRCAKIVLPSKVAIITKVRGAK